MKHDATNRLEVVRKVREVEVLHLSGLSIDQAFEAAGVSEADYLSWRAALAGVRVDRVAELQDACREMERGNDPEQYVGRVVPGACPVCGAEEGFEGYTENLRESGACRACGSVERQRQMAFLIRHRLGLGFRGPLTLPPSTRVHNTEATGAIHHRLAASPNYTFSEFWGPQHRPGAVVNGIRHEDLQGLSFPDESLDLVLSSDVLEHMPLPYRAHAEIYRVLRPGGVHLFTVPFNFLREDDVRARIVDGEIRYVAEKLYHGDPVRPDEGILVWTIFGTEMLDRLEAIGFLPLTWRFSSPRWGIVGGALAFEARKPPEASPVWLEHVQEATAQHSLLYAQLLEARAALDVERAAAVIHEERLHEIQASRGWRLIQGLRTMRTLGLRRR